MFTYDDFVARLRQDAGNLPTDNGLGGNKSYEYNRRNRLSRATVGALVYDYSYNAQEQLAVRTQASPAATTHFIHDYLGNVIAETAGGGATGASGTVREYIWLPEAEIAPTMGSRTAIDRPLVVVEGVNSPSPIVYYVHTDHLHRPMKMTDAAKAVVWDAHWLPFGVLHDLTGAAANNLRFPGQWFQAETGLHYNWHRSYDPTFGRYTQPDPFGFVDGPSVYAYGRGSPLRYVDRDGRLAIALGGNATNAGPVGGTIGGGIVTDFTTSAIYTTIGIAIGADASAGFGLTIIPFGDICDFAGSATQWQIGPITLINIGQSNWGIAVGRSWGWPPRSLSYQQVFTKVRGPFLDKCGCDVKW